MTLSAAQITAQLERVLASEPAAAAIAIRAAARQTWPDTVAQRGRQFALRWCESPLAIREALCEAERQDPAKTGLVVLTPLGTHEIAEDIAARLARARVYQPEGWDMVRHLFQAKETDARLGRFAWMPQLLIDGAAQGPYPPARNGFLSLEAAWQQVLTRFLELPNARPDTVALLQWTMTTRAGVMLEQLSAAARQDALRWLAESAGGAGELVLGCVESGRTPDAVPLGLVCGVVFATEGEGQAALGQAAIRLERFVQDRHIGVGEARAWTRAAEQAVRSASAETGRAAIDRADALLRDLRVAEFAHLSDVLPSAMDQRLQEFAHALSSHVGQPSAASLAQVEQKADRALAHTLLAAQAARAERVQMARRLARWLLGAAAPGAPLADRAAWQADEGAFVDWARFRLLGGDELPQLSQAYATCRHAVLERRNRFAGSFAQALVDWNAQQPQPAGRIVPVESVLDRVLAPIATNHPVLLLVMDGLSISIFRELFAGVASFGWTEAVPAELHRPLVGMAALPTITEVSRASLLCGTLTLGAAAQERSGFAAHPALLAPSRRDHPPRVFHKGDLTEETHLAAEVRGAIGNPQQRIVGLVYNAVDDHLSGPDQLHQRWSLEDLRLLSPILHEAREARRVVIVTADHGHLLEDGTTQVAAEAQSDRWRPGADPKSPAELLVRGGRVVRSDGSNSVVCLWDESTRYAGRKNGYHGGLSPQEVTVPLAVLLPSGVSVPDWEAAPPQQPEWWELPPVTAQLATPEAPSARPPVRQPSAPAGQPQLFDDNELPRPAPGATVSDWIAELLVAPIYASQKQLAARVALPDDRMRALLGALAERGGKLSRAALAQKLAQPEMRLVGILSAARRVLNVDQAQVLVVDETAGTIELNLALLQQQFKLESAGGRS